MGLKFTGNFDEEEDEDGLKSDHIGIEIEFYPERIVERLELKSDHIGIEISK